MRKQAIWDAVHEVGIHTRAVEDLIESTLVELAELQSKVVQVSNVAGVSYSTLQDSFEGVSATINDLVKARGTMAHLSWCVSRSQGEDPGRSDHLVGRWRSLLRQGRAHRPPLSWPDKSF